MKECDILEGAGVKIDSDPPTYFHEEENPRIYARYMLSVFFV